MKKQQFQTICSAVERGKLMKVEHQVTHQHGRVLACDGSGFEVATAGGGRKNRQHWERSNCDQE